MGVDVLFREINHYDLTAHLSLRCHWIQAKLMAWVYHIKAKSGGRRDCCAGYSVILSVSDRAEHSMICYGRN
jgi:hypothetical protein